MLTPICSIINLEFAICRLTSRSAPSFLRIRGIRNMQWWCNNIKSSKRDILSLSNAMESATDRCIGCGSLPYSHWYCFSLFLSVFVELNNCLAPRQYLSRSTFRWWNLQISHETFVAAVSHLSKFICKRMQGNCANIQYLLGSDLLIVSTPRFSHPETQISRILCM